MPSGKRKKRKYVPLRSPYTTRHAVLQAGSRNDDGKVARAVLASIEDAKRAELEAAHSRASVENLAAAKLPARWQLAEPVARDGNCLFHCMALIGEVSGVRREHAEWRLAVATTLNGWEGNPASLPCVLSERYSVGRYRGREGREGFYGEMDQCWLLAAAVVLECSVCLVVVDEDVGGSVLAREIHVYSPDGTIEERAGGVDCLANVGEVGAFLFLLAEHFHVALPVLPPSASVEPAGATARSDGDDVSASDDMELSSQSAHVANWSFPVTRNLRGHPAPVEFFPAATPALPLTVERSYESASSAAAELSFDASEDVVRRVGGSSQHVPAPGRSYASVAASAGGRAIGRSVPSASASSPSSSPLSLSPSPSSSSSSASSAPSSSSASRSLIDCRPSSPVTVNLPASTPAGLGRVAAAARPDTPSAALVSSVALPPSQASPVESLFVISRQAGPASQESSLPVFSSPEMLGNIPASTPTVSLEPAAVTRARAPCRARHGRAWPNGRGRRMRGGGGGGGPSNRSVGGGGSPAMASPPPAVATPSPSPPPPAAPGVAAATSGAAGTGRRGRGRGRGRGVPANGGRANRGRPRGRRSAVSSAGQPPAGDQSVIRLDGPPPVARPFGQSIADGQGRYPDGTAVRRTARFPQDLAATWANIAAAALTNVVESAGAERLEALGRLLNLPAMAFPLRFSRHGGGRRYLGRVSRHLSIVQRDAYLPVVHPDVPGMPSVPVADGEAVAAEPAVEDGPLPFAAAVGARGASREEESSRDSSVSSSGDEASEDGPRNRAGRRISRADRTLRARVVRLIREGRIKRAFKLLSRSADFVEVDGDVKQALAGLFPQPAGVDVLPAPPRDVDALPVVISDETMAVVLKVVNDKHRDEVAGGMSGWSFELLNAATDYPVVVEALRRFLQVCCRGELSAEETRLLWATHVTPLRKTNGSLRPIGLGEVFVSCIETALLHTIPTAAECLLPGQFGFGPGKGADVMSIALRSLLEADFTTAVKMDFVNAFGSVHRSALLRALYARPELSALFPYVYNLLSTNTPLYVSMNGAWSHLTDASEGVRQGSPLSPLLFSLVVRLCAERAAIPASSKLFAYLDDLVVLWRAAGSHEDQMALERLVRELRECGLRLNVDDTSKSAAYVRPDVDNVDDVVAQLSDYLFLYSIPAVSTVGFSAVGTRIGSSVDEAAFCRDKMAKLRQALERLHDDGVVSTHAAMILLRVVDAPMLTFLLRAMPDTSELQADAQLAFRELIMARLSALPDHEAEDRRVAIMENVWSVMQLALRNGGFGIRSPVRIGPLAFLSAFLEMSKGDAGIMARLRAMLGAARPSESVLAAFKALLFIRDNAASFRSELDGPERWFVGHPEPDSFICLPLPAPDVGLESGVRAIVEAVMAAVEAARSKVLPPKRLQHELQVHVDERLAHIYHTVDAVAPGSASSPLSLCNIKQGCTTRGLRMARCWKIGWVLVDDPTLMANLRLFFDLLVAHDLERGRGFPRLCPFCDRSMLADHQQRCKKSRQGPSIHGHNGVCGAFGELARSAGVNFVDKLLFLNQIDGKKADFLLDVEGVRSVCDVVVTFVKPGQTPLTRLQYLGRKKREKHSQYVWLTMPDAKVMGIPFLAFGGTTAEVADLVAALVRAKVQLHGGNPKKAARLFREYRRAFALITEKLLFRNLMLTSNLLAACARQRPDGALVAPAAVEPSGICIWPDDGGEDDYEEDVAAPGAAAATAVDMATQRAPNISEAIGPAPDTDDEANDEDERFLLTCFPG